MIREDLLTALAVSSSALAPENETVAPIFRCFCFTEGSVIAYDDIVGVRAVTPEVDFQGVVPGRLLHKFVKSCTGKHLTFEPFRREEERWRVKCGSTKLDFNRREVEDFPFRFPEAEGDAVVELGDDFFAGLDLCTKIVPDRGLSTWVGAVFFCFGKELRLLSTNVTRNEIRTYTVECKGTRVGKDVCGRCIVLPVMFCKAALSLHKAYPEEAARLSVSASHATISFSEVASVFGRAVSMEGVSQAVKRIEALLSDFGDLISLQDNLRESLVRAAAISDDGDWCRMRVEDGKMFLRTDTKAGCVRDTLGLQGTHDDIKVRTDPKRLAKSLDHCVEFRLAQRFTVLRGGGYVRFVSNLA